MIIESSTPKGLQACSSAHDHRLYESAECLNVAALGDKSELMRQTLSARCLMETFSFPGGNMRLSSEILAKSFVFPALSSSLLSLWLVSGD